jgi:hypothetical protein
MVYISSITTTSLSTESARGNADPSETLYTT